MKLLITGGCGFLGSNIAEVAIKKGFEVCIYDNLSRVGSQQNFDFLSGIGKILFFQKDIRDKASLSHTFNTFKPDIIFHLAGQVAMTKSLQNPIEDFEINALGTLNIIDLCRTITPYALLVYSSTNKVYGGLEYLKYEESEFRFNCNSLPLGMNEDLKLDFQSPYGCSKGSADSYLLDAYRVFDLQTVVFRHSSMYGGRQFATFDQGWVGWFCKVLIDIKNKTIKNNNVEIHGSGKQVRDLLFASDMVDLYFKTIEHRNSITGQAFNIGGGMNNSMSLLELLFFLSNQLNVNIEIVKKDMRKSDQKIFVADLSKANKLLSWYPKVSNTQGLKIMLEWVKSISK